MWYRACNRTRDGRLCRKKVTESDSNPGSFNCRCGERNLSESETEMRYMVNMNIMDSTSSVWAIMFDAGSLFQKSAQEMYELRKKNEKQFDDKIAETLWTLTNFSVTAKVETFNGSPKLKFTIHFAERVWQDIAESPALYRKGPRNTLCRWFGWMECFEAWDEHHHSRLLVMLYWGLATGLITANTDTRVSNVRAGHDISRLPH